AGSIRRKAPEGQKDPKQCRQPLVEPLESDRATMKCYSSLLPPVVSSMKCPVVPRPSKSPGPDGPPVQTHTHEGDPVLEPPVSNTLFMFLSREIQAGWLRFGRLVVRVSSVVALHPV